MTDEYGLPMTIGLAADPSIKMPYSKVVDHVLAENCKQLGVPKSECPEARQSPTDKFGVKISPNGDVEFVLPESVSTYGLGVSVTGNVLALIAALCVAIRKWACRASGHSDKGQEIRLGARVRALLFGKRHPSAEQVDRDTVAAARIPWIDTAMAGGNSNSDIEAGLSQPALTGPTTPPPSYHSPRAEADGEADVFHDAQA